MSDKTPSAARLDALARKHVAFHETPRVMAAMDVDWPDQTETGWHSHPRGQLLYAISGVMTVHSPLGVWVVPADRALWLKAGLEHNVRMTGEVQIRTVFIDEAAATGLPPQTCVLDVSDLLRALIVAAAAAPADHVEGARDALIMGLLIEEVRVSAALPLHLPLPTDPRIRMVCESLNRQPSDSATAAEWAARAGIASKTLQRAFLKETGLSFAQWREQSRLLFALRRLAAGDRVIDVAYDCGYASQSAFSVMFKRRFGAPPSGFQRQA